MPEISTASRVVLVTGAGSGIGAATAQAFLERGDRVAGLYSKTPPAKGILPVQADITNTEQLQAAFADVEAEFGPVEVLVAAAGISDSRLLLQMDEEQFIKILDTNLVSAYRLTKLAVRRMIRARTGRIILVGSVGAFGGVAGQTHYAAAKAGLLGFARSLAREVASRNITVNLIAPGWTDTDMVSYMTDNQRADAAAEVPLGRFATPAEIAHAALFLADNAYITGAVIPVDGGIALGL